MPEPFAAGTHDLRYGYPPPNQELYQTKTVRWHGLRAVFPVQSAHRVIHGAPGRHAENGNVSFLKIYIMNTMCCYTINVL